MKIFIKNMVCNRCITAVDNIFKDLKIDISHLQLGEVETENTLSDHDILILEKKLQDNGFDRLRDSSHQVIEKIKNLIIVKIHDLDISDNFVLSEFLSHQINKDYSALSKAFSQNENHTLEQYFILQKIEKVKELLLYNELNLTEIAGKLGYKSVQHLSTQFKSNTGFTPTEFKKLKEHNRKALDKI
ncbi:helix-turn-helix domain-containing protein [Chryseobacterium sp. T1]